LSRNQKSKLLITSIKMRRKFVQPPVDFEVGFVTFIL
jgi:hypothetical protein